MEENKKISEMTEKEILRHQLELLAETSQGYDVENLPEYTKAMIEIYDRLEIRENYIPLKKSIEPEHVYKTISNFLKRERSETEKALKSEKRQVCIKADSYIAKEIKYQTALLHELLDEVRNTKK